VHRHGSQPAGTVIKTQKLDLKPSRLILPVSAHTLPARTRQLAEKSVVLRGTSAVLCRNIFAIRLIAGEFEKAKSPTRPFLLHSIFCTTCYVFGPQKSNTVREVSNSFYRSFYLVIIATADNLALPILFQRISIYTLIILGLTTPHFNHNSSLNNKTIRRHFLFSVFLSYYNVVIVSKSPASITCGNLTVILPHACSRFASILCRFYYSGKVIYNE